MGTFDNIFLQHGLITHLINQGKTSNAHSCILRRHSISLIGI